MLLASELKNGDGRVRMSVKTGWFKGFLAFGIGAGGSVAALLSLADAFEKNPSQGVDLLKSWGPWALVVGLVVFFVYQIAAKSIDTARDAMNAWVETAKTQAQASTRTADALTKLAGKDDRQMQEMQTLTSYTAKQTEKTHELLRQILQRMDHAEVKRP